MKKSLMILGISICLLTYKTIWAIQKSVSHVYLVFYATHKGKTGHMGIAVDNYKIIYKELQQGANTIIIADTLFTGELTYYDMWPNDDYFNITRTGKDIPGLYYKLPLSSIDAITINSLCDKGLPHKEKYPSDGLLQINTTFYQDQWLVNFLDSMVQANRSFNGRQFNCSDFVRLPLEKLLNTPLKSNEFVLLGWSTTPNKLYRCLRKIKNTVVIKNADKKAAGSFVRQRVLFSLFHH